MQTAALDRSQVRASHDSRSRSCEGATRAWCAALVLATLGTSLPVARVAAQAIPSAPLVPAPAAPSAYAPTYETSPYATTYETSPYAPVAQPGYGSPVVLVALPPDAGVRLARAQHGRSLQRTGLTLAPLGMAMAAVGFGLLFASSFSCFEGCAGAPSRVAGVTLLAFGYATDYAGLVTGAAGAVMVSNQFARLGIAGHRRGLAISALAFSVMPFYGGFLSLILNGMHFARTRAVFDSIQVVGPSTARRAPVLFSSPFFDARTRTFGNTWGVRF